jgi:hypothetical protein
MTALHDLTDFVVILGLTGAGYLLLAEGTDVDDQLLSIVAFTVGILAIVVIAYRFREDFVGEDEP